MGIQSLFWYPCPPPSVRCDNDEKGAQQKLKILITRMSSLCAILG